MCSLTDTRMTLGVWTTSPDDSVRKPFTKWQILHYVGTSDEILKNDLIGFDQSYNGDLILEL